MNFLSKIKAFFIIKGKQEQMELVSAEINWEGAILHPLEDPERSFFVPSNNIEIFINPDGDFCEDDVIVVDNYEPEGEEDSQNVRAPEDFSQEGEESLPPHSRIPRIEPRALSKFIPAKKRFSVMLYPDEYEMLMKNISENGYKKVEYFLACMTSVKKQSMNSVYKRYTAEHAKRRQADLCEAKRAQAEDYMLRRAEAEQTKE